MKIEIEIPASTINDLWVTAIESGDPVTTAARGGWCKGIYLIMPEEKQDKEGPWYDDEELWKGYFCVRVAEVDDEVTGHTTDHLVGQADMARGLGIMATKFPHLFAHIVGDNIDAPCADIFLQCVLFGEEKYA